MGKYEQKMYQLSQAEPPPGFKKQTKLLANIIIEADAEIADLRAKCEALAGAVTYANMMCDVYDTAPPSVQGAIQIAREVRK